MIDPRHVWLLPRLPSHLKLCASHFKLQVLFFFLLDFLVRKFGHSCLLGWLGTLFLVLWCTKPSLGAFFGMIEPILAQLLKYFRYSPPKLRLMMPFFGLGLLPLPFWTPVFGLGWILHWNGLRGGFLWRIDGLGRVSLRAWTEFLFGLPCVAFLGSVLWSKKVKIWRRWGKLRQESYLFFWFIQLLKYLLMDCPGILQFCVF